MPTKVLKNDQNCIKNSKMSQNPLNFHPTLNSSLPLHILHQLKNPEWFLIHRRWSRYTHTRRECCRNCSIYFGFFSLSVASSSPPCHTTYVHTEESREFFAPAHFQVLFSGALSGIYWLTSRERAENDKK